LRIESKPTPSARGWSVTDNDLGNQTHHLVGKAVTPKLRTHLYFGMLGIVRAVHEATEEITVETAAGARFIRTIEKLDDWKSA
jgi:hypothetical protein